MGAGMGWRPEFVKLVCAGGRFVLERRGAASDLCAGFIRSDLLLSGDFGGL